MKLPTQIGKTTFLNALMLALSVNDPAPGMLAGPDMDDIRKVRDDLYAIADSSQALKKRVPSGRLRNMMWIVIDGVRWYLAWSGNTQRLSGKSCRWVFCTEVDKWQQSPHEGLTQDLVRERVKAFDSHLILWESTPTNESSVISDKYDDSDQRRYLMPCPSCNHYQEFRFHVHTEGPYVGCGGVVGYQDEEGKLLSPDAALSSSYYACERGCRIDESDRAWMISQGRWVPAGQWIDRNGKLQGEPTRGPRIAGFTAPSLIGRTITFGKMAAEYITSRGDPRKEQNFDNNWQGIKRQTRQTVPEWKSIGRKLQASHPRGTVPPGAFFLTCAVDVQHDRCYWVVRAWGVGKTSWRVDRGMINRTAGSDGKLVPGSDLRQLQQTVLSKDYPVLGGSNAVGWSSLRVAVAGVDVGFETAQVHAWIKSVSGSVVRAVRGSSFNIEPFFKCSRVERSARTGQVYDGGLDIWEITTPTYKTDIRARWRSSADEAGYWWTDGTPLVDDELYLRDITNEFERPKKSGKGFEWVVHDSKWRNDWWDCEVYNSALADMVTGFGWSEDDLMALARPQRTGGTGAVLSHVVDTEFSAR